VGQAHNSGGYEFIQMRALGRGWAGVESAEGQPVPPAAQTVTYYFNIRGEKRHPRGQCECV